MTYMQKTYTYNVKTLFSVNVTKKCILINILPTGQKKLSMCWFLLSALHSKVVVPSLKLDCIVWFY